MTIQKPVKQYIVVALTLKLKSDPTTSEIIYLANRPLTIKVEGGDYPGLNILKSVSGIGEEVDNFISKSSSATLTLINTPGSAGYQRRFSDFLDRYTLAKQPAIIYYFESADTLENTVAIESDFISAYQGFAEDVSLQDTTARVAIRHISPLSEYLNYIVPSNGYFETDSCGNILPLPVGEWCPVKPTIMLKNVSSGTGTLFGVPTGSSSFGLATNRVNYSGSAWASEGKLNYPAGLTATNMLHYVQVNGRYQFLTSASSSHVSFDNSSGGSTLTGSVYPTSGGLLGTEVCFPLEYNDATCCSVTGFRLLLNYYSSAATKGTIIFAIKSQELNDQAINPKSAIEVTYNYNLMTTTSPANKTIVFPEPVILEYDKFANRKYFLSIKNETDQVIQFGMRDAGAPSVPYYVYTDMLGWVTSNSSIRYDGLVYGVYLQYRTLIAEVAVKQGKAPFVVTASTLHGLNCDTSKLDLVCLVGGYNNGSGTPPTFYNSPITAIKYLMREYNSTTKTWGASTRFDDSYFSDSHGALTLYPRQLDGMITAKVTMRQAAEKICTETFCRFAFNKDKWGVYIYGCNLAVSKIIYDKDIIDLRYSIKDSSSVVNYIEAVYGPNLLSTDVGNSFLAERWWSYAGSHTAGGADDPISANSVALYGIIEKAAEAYDLLIYGGSVSNSIKSVLLLTLMLNNLPGEYIDITLPYTKFHDLDILDIVRVESASLPSNFGSTISPNPYIYTDTDDDTHTAKILGATGRTRNQAKEGQVISREIILNNTEEPALLRLLIKVNNHFGGIY